MAQKLEIKSFSGSYTVNFTADITRDINILIEKRPVHILCDRGVYKAYDKLFGNLRKPKSFRIFSSREKNKSFQSVSAYINFLINKQIQRNDVIVVIGGGQVQDVGAFSAHIILRGVPWIFVPTTFLSMSDSCIGSKSALNIGQYKNQIGAFQAPEKVYISTSFLKTLSRDRMLDGIGEIVKHAILAGGKTYSELISDLRNVFGNESTLQKVIYKSLKIKKKYIEEDEFDKGIRKFLNFGHTFGHALEGYSKNKIPHGIAVSVGMDMANFVSYKRGLLKEKYFRQLSAVIQKYIPFNRIPVKSIAMYINYIKHDKKAYGDGINAILCQGIGDFKIVNIRCDQELYNNIKEYCKYYIKAKNNSYETG